MILAFLLIFFGVRSYRDNVGGGTVGFGRALAVGALISVVASVFCVATWELIFYKLEPDFGTKYGAYQVEKALAAGATEQAIAAKKAEMEKFAEMYKNLAINAALTFVEPMPVALIIALVSAGVLRRRKKDGDAR